MISEPVSYGSLIEAVFVPNPNLPCKVLYSNGQTKVTLVKTPEPLVVRVVRGRPDDRGLQQAIIEAIANDVTARILHSESRQIGDDHFFIQVQTYLPGVPLDHYPTDDEGRAIAKTTYVLHRRLCAISMTFEPSGIPRLGEISAGLLSVAENGPMKEAARQLVENSRYQELVTEDLQVLTYGDPWPQNYLFDSSDGALNVHIVDVDLVLLGPIILQPAMLFSAYFVISYLQDASAASLSSRTLDEWMTYWPEPINRQDVLLMMQVYPILLMLQKVMMFDGTSEADLALHQANLALLARCLDVVQQLE